MKTRIKELRKALGLTQFEFAKRVGMKQNTVASYEIGRITPSDSAINNICKEFGVNEGWLRSGSGEMVIPRGNTELDALMYAHPRVIPEARALIERFMELPEEKQRIVIDFFCSVADEVSGIRRVPESKMDEINRRADQYRDALLMEARVEEGFAPTSQEQSVG